MVHAGHEHGRGGGDSQKRITSCLFVNPAITTSMAIAWDIVAGSPVSPRICISPSAQCLSNFRSALTRVEYASKWLRASCLYIICLMYVLSSTLQWQLIYLFVLCCTPGIVAPKHAEMLAVDIVKAQTASGDVRVRRTWDLLVWVRGSGVCVIVSRHLFGGPGARRRTACGADTCSNFQQINQALDSGSYAA